MTSEIILQHNFPPSEKFKSFVKKGHGGGGGAGIKKCQGLLLTCRGVDRRGGVLVLCCPCQSYL